jgi:hypothetical protein
MEGGMFSTDEILKRKQQQLLNSICDDDFDKVRDKVEDKED